VYRHELIQHVALFNTLRPTFSRPKVWPDGSWADPLPNEEVLLFQVIDIFIVELLRDSLHD